MPECCATCARWIVRRRTIYGDGSIMETFRAPEGKGFCERLNIETEGAFYCNRFESDGGRSRDPHIIDEQKPGAPWQHWTMIPCPDCAGAGSSNDRPDDRCAGTGKVRLYDDGHVGDERTRRHPKEVAAGARPRCANCDAEVDPTWKACPTCGHRLEAPASVEVVSGLGGASV